jgi:chemotaxis family two-component system sensor kinase Cph1
MTIKTSETSLKDELKILKAELAKREADAYDNQRLSRLVHELEVHQEELSVQNEELLKVRSEFEHALRRYTALFDGAPVGYFLTSPQQVIVEVNACGAELLATTRRHLEGKPFTLYVGKDSRSQFDRHHRAVMSGHSQEGEFLFHRVDNSEFVAQVRSIPFIAEGNSHECLSTVTDVTARRRAETQASAAMAELKRSNFDLQQFAYVASHDLQEPLRMISSYLQLIERRYHDSLDKDAAQFIDFAVDGAKRMQQLILGLLDYSRIETRGHTLEAVDSRSAIEVAISHLSILIAEKTAKIEIGRTPEVLADSLQLGQLFQNIIGNSIKFHRPGERPRVSIDAVKDGDFEHFTISDNGIGIDLEYRDRIFLIFQRLHTHDEYPGTGIGLAICKRIIERHGGRIWVDGNHENGCCFHFTLPIAQA